MVESLRDSMKYFLSKVLQSISCKKRTRFSAEKPRRFKQSTRHRFSFSFANWKPSAAGFNWRGETDLQGSISPSAEYGICKACFDEVVGQNGLEPSTSRLSVVCSSQLSYWPIWWRLAGSNRWPPACKAGALPAELNPQIFSHLRLLGTFLAAPSKLNNVKF